MATGELIRKRRLELGMTQRELGERCGIAEPTIRRYEAGKLNPKLETCQKIATALNVPVAYLLNISSETKGFIEKMDGIITRINNRIQEMQESERDEKTDETIAEFKVYLSMAEELKKEYTSKAFQEDALNKSIAEIRTKADISKRQRRTTKLISAFEQLNDEGQMTAVSRVEELALIPKFQRLSAE